MPGEPLTIWSVRIALMLLAAGLVSNRVQPRRQRLARWLWTAGFLLLLVHVLVAFHYYHHWSHRAALEDTARRTGEQLGWSFGGGLYFNYVFVMLWGLDAGWWWLAAEPYARRPAALTAVINGFLLLIAFNATVVFESGPTRWIAAVVFAGIAVGFWATYRRERAEGVR